MFWMSTPVIDHVVEEQIQQLKAAALQRIEEAKDPDALEQVRVEVLGRKGFARAIQRGQLPPEERKTRARR